MYACLVCTSVSRDRALCDACADELWARREPTERDVGAYRTRAPFAWRRDGWPALRWWAKGLKNKVDPVFWREAATWSLDLFGRPAVGTSLVPVPNSGCDPNHALGYASALGSWAGVAVADVLVARPERRHQRRQDLFGRRSRRYDLEGEVPRGAIVVVDDVITSGATIEAAYRALGQPARFEAWCVMDRRPPGNYCAAPAAPASAGLVGAGTPTVASRLR